MPKRLIDGEALWRSDKLMQVKPAEFRSEYANLIPLAESDGSFEANARRVWTEVYSYNRPDVTPDLVEEMLDEFERVGMIARTKDENGKIWGFFIGIEVRLPPQSQRDKYKQGKAHLFNGLVKSIGELDELQTNSTEGLADVKLGLVRFGSGLDSNRCGPQVAATGTETSSAVPIFQEGMYPSKNSKQLHKYVVEIWQKIKGISAVARYPSRYPQKWEELCENHSGDLIIPAFELWARDEGSYSQTEYPIVDFLKVAARYMNRIVPVKKINPYASIEAADDANTARVNAEFIAQQEKDAVLAKQCEGVPY